MILIYYNNKKLILSDLGCLDMTLLSDCVPFHQRKIVPNKVTAELLLISKS